MCFGGFELPALTTISGAMFGEFVERGVSPLQLFALVGPSGGVWLPPGGGARRIKVSPRTPS
jgi:hypothetical protein